MRGSIDIVVIENSAGISVEMFHISELAKAEEKAKEMSNYHGNPYIVKIRNVTKSQYPHLGGLRRE